MDISTISSAVQSLGLSNTNNSATSSSSVDGTEMFSSIYDQLTGSVNETDSAFQADIVKAAAGELDNPAQLVIDSSKAQVALQLASSVRNTALSAYKEIMNMSV